MSLLCHEEQAFPVHRSIGNSQIPPQSTEQARRWRYPNGTRPKSSNLTTSLESSSSLNQSSSGQNSATSFVSSNRRRKSSRRKSKASGRKHEPTLRNTKPQPVHSDSATVVNTLTNTFEPTFISEREKSTADENERIVESSSDALASNQVKPTDNTSTGTRSRENEPQSDIPEPLESASSKPAPEDAKVEFPQQSTSSESNSRSISESHESIPSVISKSDLISGDTEKELITESDKQNGNTKTENKVVDPEAKEKCNTLKKNVGIVLDKPRSPSLAILGARVATFKTWPTSSGQNPNILAEAGFFYKGKDDLVECFHCSVLISDWLLTLDPWKVHVEKYSFCAHVRQCKGDKFIFNILGDDENVSDTDDDDAKIEFAIERNKDAIEAAQSIFSFNDAQIREAIKIIIIDDVKQKFSGTDLVKVIDDIKEKAEIQSRQPKPLGILQPTSLPPTPKPEEEELIVEDLQAENERLKSPMMCKVCFNGEACIITLPCGHMAACPQCVSALKDCPICRGSVKECQDGHSNKVGKF